MDVRIRPAAPAEGGRLREIAVASKLHWGYAQEDVLRWVANGDFSPAGLRAKEFYVADADGVVVAFASLVAGEVAVLDDLWVEPGWIGKGVGATLFRAVADRAAALGARSLGMGRRAACGRVLRTDGRHASPRERAERVGESSSGDGDRAVTRIAVLCDIHGNLPALERSFRSWTSIWSWWAAISLPARFRSRHCRCCARFRFPCGTSEGTPIASSTWTGFRSRTEVRGCGSRAAGGGESAVPGRAPARSRDRFVPLLSRSAGERHGADHAGDARRAAPAADGGGRRARRRLRPYTRAVRPGSGRGTGSQWRERRRAL